MAGIVRGSVGGACINNFTLFAMEITVETSDLLASCTVEVGETAVWGVVFDAGAELLSCLAEEVEVTLPDETAVEGGTAVSSSSLQHGDTVHVDYSAAYARNRARMCRHVRCTAVSAQPILLYLASLLLLLNTTPQQSNTSLEIMELYVQGLGKDFLMEVGENDTTETMRQKVASATGLCEDSFRMGFGGKEEGEDITELSAGDTVVLTKTMKYEAISALHALGETDITAERLQQVEDPKVASLLLQAEVATEIPEAFFSSSDVTRIGFSCVPTVDDNCGITLHLPALPCVTTIAHGFLYSCIRLSEVDLTGLQAVTTIGDDFLSQCTTLSEVDLTGLQSVTTIGDYFLFDCQTLSKVDLTGLQAVTTIGDDFLSSCTSLSKVDGRDKCSNVVRSRLGYVGF